MGLQAKLSIMTNSTFNQTSSMDTLDKQLCQLVIETCYHPRFSLERQKGLNEIIWRIQQSGKLLSGVGVPDYEDAIQQTWLYFCRNLCEATTGDAYNPERASVITWLNAYLKHRLQDIRIKAASNAIAAYTHLSDFDESLNPVDNIAAPPAPLPILEDILEWVELEGSLLRSIHLRDRPEINCQVLIQRRLPPETTWEQLAKEFGVGISSLSKFYQRECFPRLLNFGKSQGYLES